jgi:hypothetical protein
VIVEAGSLSQERKELFRRLRTQRGLPAAEQEALAMARRICGEPFDLCAGPLLRCWLLRLRDDLHLFVMVVHHIVFDGWSLPIVIGELAEAYRAQVAGRPAQLGTLGLSYADFAVWQREWLATAAADGQPASQLLARMSAAFQVDLTVASLFDAPTVAGAARAVSAARRRCAGPGLRRPDRSQYRAGQRREG